MIRVVLALRPSCQLDCLLSASAVNCSLALSCAFVIRSLRIIGRCGAANRLQIDNFKIQQSVTTLTANSQLFDDSYFAIVVVAAATAPAIVIFVVSFSFLARPRVKFNLRFIIDLFKIAENHEA